MKPIAIDLEDLPPDLTAVHAYWQKLRGAAFAPSWRQFDLMELPPGLLPTTAVCDIAEDMSKTTFRYWGSGLTLVQGRDMTGGCMGDMQPPAHGRNIIAAHEWVVENRRPNAGGHGRDELGAVARVQVVLRLPLSSDGETVDKTVVCVDYSEEARRMIERSREAFIDALDRSYD